MPWGLAVFNERRRQRLALILSIVAALGAIGSFPVGIYTLNVRAYFFSETHYFVRAEGQFAVKSSFGFGAILTVPVFIVCFCWSVVCWYNSSPPRRWGKTLFNIVMTTLMWCTFALWIATLSAFIIMTTGSMDFNKALEKGITTAMLNYDGRNTTRIRDKEMLDLLHISKQCCGVDGWQSFQWEAFHLQNFSKIMVRKLNEETSFHCKVDHWCYVPWSCCRKDSGPFCSNQRFDLSLEDEIHSETLYDLSCYDSLIDIFVPIYNRMAAIWLTYFIIFYILFIGTRWFHTSVMMSLEYRIPLTPGWVFPCGGQSKQEIMTVFEDHLTNKCAIEGLYEEPFENPYPEGYHPADIAASDSEDWTTEEEYSEDDQDPYPPGPGFDRQHPGQQGVRAPRINRRKPSY